MNPHKNTTIWNNELVWPYQEPTLKLSVLPPPCQWKAPFHHVAKPSRWKETQTGRLWIPKRMQPFELLNWCPRPLSKHWCNPHFKNVSSNIFAHINLLLRLATTAGQPSGSSFEKHCQASLASLPPLRLQSSGVHLAAHCSMKAYLQVVRIAQACFHCWSAKWKQL